MGEELKDAAASKESKTLFIFTSFTYNIFQFNKSKHAKSLQSFLNLNIFVSSLVNTLHFCSINIV